MTTPDAGSDPDRTARSITGKADTAVRSPTLELRQGQVTAVNVATARVSVSLGGDTTAIPDVAHVSNYRPTVNDVVSVLVNGPDLYVLDRVGALGPSVIASAGYAEVNPYEARSSTAFGDLATFGPQLTTSVSPSGRLLIGLSAANDSTVANDGGFMGFTLAGANSRNAISGSAFINYVATVNAYVLATKVVYLDGLNPGSTTVTAKYASIQGGTVSWSTRQIWVLPL